MNGVGGWLKSHIAELIGALAALGLLVFVWLQSRGGGTPAAVAPASQLPSSGGSSSGGGTSDIQSAIQQALGGYVTTAQEQADLQAIGQQVTTLATNTQTALQTATTSLQQGEQQDVQTLTNNLTLAKQNISQLSTQYGQLANSLQATNQAQAQQASDFASQLQNLASQYGSAISGLQSGVTSQGQAISSLRNQTQTLATGLVEIAPGSPPLYNAGTGRQQLVGQLQGSGLNVSGSEHLPAAG